MTTTLSAANVTAAADALRVVLETVESGDLPAGPDQAAWLRGAIDALAVVVRVSAEPVSEP